MSAPPRLALLLVGLLVIAAPRAVAAAEGAAPAPGTSGAPEDRVRGYAEAWLRHVARVDPSTVEVSLAGGVVTLTADAPTLARLDALVEELRSLPGVTDVARRLALRERRPPEAPVGPAGRILPRRWNSWARWILPEEGRRTILFPTGDLFTAPLADQKQPRFHTTWQRYDLDFGTFDIASVGFGENFGLVRAPRERDGDGWQLGVSGAVFAVFNLDSDSFDLLNADYYIGFPFSWRRGPVSARARLYHRSSHLGDEFLLQPQPGPRLERINLSYETLELLGSWERRGFRAYGGGSRIVRTDTPLERGRGQLGVEYQGPRLRALNGRFLAGLDLQWWEETDWDRDLSVKVGLQLANPYGGPRSVQVLLEHYDGHVPHGQFYVLETEYWGLGLAFSL